MLRSLLLIRFGSFRDGNRRHQSGLPNVFRAHGDSSRESRSGLGQAAQLVYSLPAGAVADIVPVGSANNVTGLIDGNPVSADSLASPLGNTTSYFSALYNSPFSTRWFVITFGTDTSLTTGPGWDNVTGVGTPNGANFINAIAQ